MRFSGGGDSGEFRGRGESGVGGDWCHGEAVSRCLSLRSGCKAAKLLLAIEMAAQLFSSVGIQLSDLDTSVKLSSML